jgi:hypothetical protein
VDDVGHPGGDVEKVKRLGRAQVDNGGKHHSVNRQFWGSRIKRRKTPRRNISSFPGKNPVLYQPHND